MSLCQYEIVTNTIVMLTTGEMFRKDIVPHSIINILIAAVISSLNLKVFQYT